MKQEGNYCPLKSKRMLYFPSMLSFQMTAQKPYICLICHFIVLIDHFYRHVFEEHIRQHAPLKCLCGYIRGTEKGLLRYQIKERCHGPFLKLPGINIEEYLRRASQSECSKSKVQSEVNPEGSKELDFNDWLLAAEEQKSTSTASTQTDDGNCSTSTQTTTIP